MTDPSKTLLEQAMGLLHEQQRSWSLLADNCRQLAACQVRSFPFDGGRVNVKAQFNPSRYASVSARTDDESIRSRKCFLCDENRPPEQLSVNCGGGFKLLCNPFPILPEHFTIVHEQRRPQRILDSIDTLLDLTGKLGRRLMVFYNGPQCGASAPDHLHFQAGQRVFMPVDSDYDNVKTPLGTREGTSAFTAGGDYLRRFISFESRDPGALAAAFTGFHHRTADLFPHAAEPMMNVMATAEPDGTLRLIIFPRVKHRPSFYFASDHTRMMLSPGSVDMGGVVVMPLEEDFRRVAADHLVEMYAQVTAPPELFAKLTDRAFPQ